jgi:hypothetical protein
MEPEGSLSCSQDPATGPYSEPDVSSQISLRSILMLSSYLRPSFPNGLFLAGYSDTKLK